ncbi:MAG: hypothetical protein H6571_04825 [Lewinellaceae bacterium]|nr:hypothetical protein [Lewinellaceae bacterium]
MSNPYLDNNNQIITGNVTLSGTNYGNVYVKSGATLTIGNGEMYMKSLTMAKGSTLNFNEDCNLKIRAKMNIGPLCNVNVEGGPSVVVYVGDTMLLMLPVVRDQSFGWIFMHRKASK